MDCRIILQKISESIFDNWECERVGDSDNYLIVTDTFLPNNDCIEIMVEPESEGKDRYLIHDAWTIFNYLFSYSINLAENGNAVEVVT